MGPEERGRTGREFFEVPLAHPAAPIKAVVLAGVLHHFEVFLAA